MPEENDAAATAYPPEVGPYPPQNAAAQPPATNPWSSATGVPPPPSPMGAPDAHNPWASETYNFPFKLAAGKGSKRDKISEFRSGEIVLSPAYVRIYGKTALP